MTLSRGDKKEARKHYLQLRESKMKQDTRNTPDELSRSKVANPAPPEKQKTRGKSADRPALLKRPDIWITLIIFALMLAAERFELFPQVENRLLGLRHALRMETLPPEETRFPFDNIIIIDTDEQFFAEYESWPLKRKDIATIVSNLKKLGAEVIALDMLMDFPNGYGEDPILASELSEAGNTLVVSQLQLRNGKLEGINTPTDVLDEATENGYTNHTLIGSMLSRLRFYPEIHRKTGVWPFAVKALAMRLGTEPKLEKGILTIGELSMSLDDNNDLWIDFPRIPVGLTFLKETPVVKSALEILMDLEELQDLDEEEFQEETEDLREEIEGKIVLVGDTSEVSHDIFETPVGEVYGVEILADTIATMMKEQPIRPAHFPFEAGVMLVLMTGYFLVARLQRFENLMFLFIILLYAAFNLYSYSYHGLVFSMTYPLAACLLSAVTINLYLFMLERRQKTFIKGAFSQYLSPAVIDVIVKDPDKLKLGGERREMTAFFSDIQGFSSVSESLTPEELVQLLNEYLTEMCNVISSHDGTVDKFEGDAIIAFWGAPLDQPEHARLGCHSAIEMQERNRELRKIWREQNRPPLFTRMGINSGPIVVGNMGSAQRMDYTIMGDTVNLAARLEGANKFYKTFSMISDNTYKLARDYIDVRQLDVIRVVGKKEPVTIYQLLAKKNGLSGEMAGLMEPYQRGLKAYQDRDFKASIAHFTQAAKLVPDDGPTQTYLKRCKVFQENPPEQDWDGVYTFTEKG